MCKENGKEKEQKLALAQRKENNNYRRRRERMGKISTQKRGENLVM